MRALASNMFRFFCCGKSDADILITRVDSSDDLQKHVFFSGSATFSHSGFTTPSTPLHVASNSTFPSSSFDHKYRRLLAQTPFSQPQRAIECLFLIVVDGQFTDLIIRFHDLAKAEPHDPNEKWEYKTLCQFIGLPCMTDIWEQALNEGTMANPMIPDAHYPIHPRAKQLLSPALEIPDEDEKIIITTVNNLKRFQTIASSLSYLGMCEHKGHPAEFSLWHDRALFFGHFDVLAHDLLTTCDKWIPKSTDGFGKTVNYEKLYGLTELPPSITKEFGSLGFRLKAMLQVKLANYYRIRRECIQKILKHPSAQTAIAYANKQLSAADADAFAREVQKAGTPAHELRLLFSIHKELNDLPPQRRQYVQHDPTNNTPGEFFKGVHDECMALSRDAMKRAYKYFQMALHLDPVYRRLIVNYYGSHEQMCEYSELYLSKHRSDAQTRDRLRSQVHDPASRSSKQPTLKISTRDFVDREAQLEANKVIEQLHRDHAPSRRKETRHKATARR